MSYHSRKIDELGAQLDEVTGRMLRKSSSDAEARQFSRTKSAWAKRLATIAMALAALFVGTVAFGLVIGPIGIGGLMTVIFLAVVAVAIFAFMGREKPVVDYKEDMPNKAVVERLDSLLVRKRAALPAPAASRIDAISRQLPLLENRLAETELLDPLAQDARRLMGKHLPELIERYERVPAEYRRERDGEGLTVDERLVQGLDAARTALDDLGRKLAHEDMAAFETQGRFIESRYKEDEGLKGE
ncbi:MAG TPA: hypothetical protein VK614_06995 [Allosphingosinicella sp.]|nr:hypothetical protein [Allosphingosinicella sp.]